MNTDSDLVFDPSATFADDDPLAPVHAFIGELRDTYGRLPAPEPRGDLATRFRDEAERAEVIPFRPSHSTAGRRARRFRRAMLVAATLAVAVVATGGLAAAGALPETVQNTVSDFLDRVGIDVPRDPASTLSSVPVSIPSSGALAAPADGNVGAPSRGPATRTSTSGEAAPNPRDPGAVPTGTVAPTSTTRVPGVPPPLPLESTPPIDVSVPPVSQVPQVPQVPEVPEVPQAPQAPQAEIPARPADVPLPTPVAPIPPGAPPGPPIDVQLPPQARVPRDGPPGPPIDVQLPPQARVPGR